MIIYFLSGRYFVGNRNGKGEEYNGFTDELIFEGDYIEGRRMDMEKNITRKNMIANW